MLRFSKPYFFIAASLLAAEVIIALYVHDGIIRPYGGDFLATIFLYCMVRSLLKVPLVWTLAAVLLLSYLIEGFQYVGLLSYLGWRQSWVARIVLGSHFAWPDMLAYTLGALAVWAAEGLCRAKETTRQCPQPAHPSNSCV